VRMLLVVSMKCKFQCPDLFNRPSHEQQAPRRRRALRRQAQIREVWGGWRCPVCARVL
jgi:hypothetical protein